MIAGDDAGTYNQKVQDWLTPGPPACTQIGYDAVPAFEPTVIVMVDVPVPGAAIVVGLKVTDTPTMGALQVESVIGEL